MKWLKGRLPAWPEVFPVYSVLIFWMYSWFMLLFFFKLPSWMLEEPPGEIMAYFSYGLVMVFLDSVKILAALTGLTFLLPPSWLKDDFSILGTMLASLLFFWIMFFQVTLQVLIALPSSRQAAVLLTALTGSVFALLFTRRLPALRKLISWFGSSTAVFAYLYGFLTAVGILIVLFRNLN